MGTINFQNLKKNYKPSLNMVFAKLVRDARIHHGLTQNKLAKLMNTKQESISRWESGESIPTIPTLEKIANVLNISFTPQKIFNYSSTTGTKQIKYSEPNLILEMPISTTKNSKTSSINY